MVFEGWEKIGGRVGRVPLRCANWETNIYWHLKPRKCGDRLKVNIYTTKFYFVFERELLRGWFITVESFNSDLCIMTSFAYIFHLCMMISLCAAFVLCAVFPSSVPPPPREQPCDQCPVPLPSVPSSASIA